MKRLQQLFKTPVERWIVTTTFIAVITGIAARVYWLAYPSTRVFDEVYFPVFAKQYLDRVSVYDTHPPFGKYIIAVGIWLFGDNGVGWRFMPLIAGIALIAAAAWLTWEFTKDKIATVLMALFIALDGAFIAYSRTGLMDGIMVLFMVCCVAMALRQTEKKSLLWLATLIGLTVAIKWVGLAIIVPIAIIMYRKERLGEFFYSLWWSAAVYFAVVVSGQWLSHADNPFAEAIRWHAEAASYHWNLVATHPWSSPWWSWPFIKRPVLFIYDGTADGSAQVMMTLGNPVVWWASTVAVILTIADIGQGLLKKRWEALKHPMFIALMAWGACYLPWMAVHRVVFIYHYLPAYLFALVMLAYWMTRLYKRYPEYVLTFAIVAVVSGLYFLPLAVGWWPLSPAALAQHIWVKSWLY